MNDVNVRAVLPIYEENVHTTKRDASLIWKVWHACMATNIYFCTYTVIYIYRPDREIRMQ